MISSNDGDRSHGQSHPEEQREQEDGITDLLHSSVQVPSEIMRDDCATTVSSFPSETYNMHQCLYPTARDVLSAEDNNPWEMEQEANVDDPDLEQEDAFLAKIVAERARQASRGRRSNETHVEEKLPACKMKAISKPENSNEKVTK